jgi:DNA-directed RNA polymerase III subunit RPC8
VTTISDELQHPSRFEEAEQAWVWEYQIEDAGDGVTKHDLFMDVGETIKFRVIDEEFTESEPTGPPTESEGRNQAQQSQNDKNTKPPYKIVGAINEAGLGIDSWWTQNDGGGDEEDEDEDE